MDIEVTRKKIRHMYLRVKDDGTVAVSAPLGMSESEIMAFVRSRSGWIEKTKELKKERADRFPEYVSHPEKKEAARKELRTRLEKRVPLMEERTGLRCRGWNIRDVKSYWGKCDTRTDKITFNLRLVNRTDEELDYVILHELCHTRFRNHDRYFWGLVESFMPGYRTVRKKLRY